MIGQEERERERERNAQEMREREWTRERGGEQSEETGDAVSAWLGAVTSHPPLRVPNEKGLLNGVQTGQLLIWFYVY